MEEVNVEGKSMSLAASVGTSWLYCQAALGVWVLASGTSSLNCWVTVNILVFPLSQGGWIEVKEARIVWETQGVGTEVCSPGCAVWAVSRGAHHWCLTKLCIACVCSMEVNSWDGIWQLPLKDEVASVSATSGSSWASFWSTTLLNNNF